MNKKVEMKPYTTNAIKFALHLVWWALQEFATLRFKSGMLLWKWAVMAFSMRHLTRAAAMSAKASLSYRKNAAVKESDVSTVKAIELIIATYNEVTRER